MKKVCILTSVHPAFDVRIFHKEAKTLAAAGYDITLIAQHPRDEMVDRVKIIALPKPKNRLFRIFGTTRRVFRLALNQKADVYHLHDPELIFIGLLLRNFTKAKVIYDVHENYPKQILSKYWIPKILTKPVSIVFNVFEKKLSKKLDFIVTATGEIEKEFKRINFNTERVSNFPILADFKNIKKEKKRQKRGQGLNMIYAGVLAEIRGITQIIKALEYAYEDIKLKLLGEFSPEDYGKTIKNLKGFEKVEYLGKVDFKEVIRHYTLADAGIICLLPQPNYINSMPIKLFEYMAAGLPVIASDFPLWTKIIRENNCGLTVDPLNPREIARATEYLMSHSEKAKKMGENGRKAVLKKFNWGKESKSLLKVYEELCEE